MGFLAVLHIKGTDLLSGSKLLYQPESGTKLLYQPDAA